MQETIERLPDVCKIKGTGTPCESKLVNRIDDVCLYKRTDGPFEVFKVKVAPAQTIFTKKYPARELYPSNEDFGRSAWCFTTEEAAGRKFLELAGKSQIDMTKPPTPQESV